MARKKVYNEDAAQDFDLGANPQPLTPATPATPAKPQQAKTAEQAPQAELEKPNDLGAMIAELTRLDNTPDVANWPREKQYEHRRKRAELGRRIHVMQQGLPTITIDANDMARERLAQAQVAASRETLIAKLKKIARR